MATVNANYVKFLRGTTIAWKNLTNKDNNTLYFISDGDGFGTLYLGSTMIAGGEVPESISINSLKDIAISEGLSDKSLLVYDEASKNWVNKTFEELVPIMTGADEIRPGAAGLVPAPKGGEQDFFLKGDGTWAKVVTDSQVFHVTPNEGESHNDAILRMTAGEDLRTGNIAIVKELIHGENYQHTAYVYDAKLAAWKAMDGNYNAENVYFDENILTTSAIGVITLENGQATIPAAGKNLKELFNTILVKEENPSTTEPSVNITLDQAGSYEVGSKVSVTYSTSLNPGSYSYGPATGVTAKSYSVSNGVDPAKLTETGSFDDITVTDTTNYRLTSTITHTAGAVPVTNTGNPYEAGAIAEGSKENTSSAITGYRPFFYGMSATPKADMVYDSAFIRGLTNGKAYNASKTLTFTAADLEGVKRFVIAIPAASITSTRTGIKSATITSSMNADALDFYNELETTIPVLGKDGYTQTVAYRVWVYEPTSIAAEEVHEVVLK